MAAEFCTRTLASILARLEAARPINRRRDGNMKRKFSALVFGAAALSADARNHVRSRSEQHKERKVAGAGSNVAEPPHAPSSAWSSFQQQLSQQQSKRQTQQSTNAHQQYHLCIYSEYAKGDKCEQLWRDQGHAALMRVTTTATQTQTETGAEPTIDTWGLWPDLNDDIIDASLSNVLGGSDVRHNFARDVWSVDKYPYMHCRHINEAQNAQLVKSIEMESQRFTGWTPWNNCASFVEAVFEDVMGVVVIPSKPWWHVGVETPCELGGHIRRLNGGSNLPDKEGVLLSGLG